MGYPDPGPHTAQGVPAHLHLQSSNTQSSFSVCPFVPEHCAPFPCASVVTVKVLVLLPVPQVTLQSDSLQLSTQSTSCQLAVAPVTTHKHFLTSVHGVLLFSLLLKYSTLPTGFQ